jgi:hypothetical protein
LHELIGVTSPKSGSDNVWNFRPHELLHIEVFSHNDAGPQILDEEYAIQIGPPSFENIEREFTQHGRKFRCKEYSNIKATVSFKSGWALSANGDSYSEAATNLYLKWVELGEPK